MTGTDAATTEDVAKLLWHYGNLYADTDLLVKYCGEMGRSLSDGFRDVCQAIDELKAQLLALAGVK